MNLEHLLSLALLQEGWDSVAFLLKVLQKYKHYSMNQSDINFWSKNQENKDKKTLILLNWKHIIPYKHG